MIIQCPACQSRYMVPSMKVGAGRHVRCKNCLHQWWHDPNANLNPLPKSFSETQPKSDMEKRLDALRQAAEQREVTSRDSLNINVEEKRIIKEDAAQRKGNPALGIFAAICFILMGLSGALVFLKEPILNAFPELQSLSNRSKQIEEKPAFWDQLAITNINRQMEEDGSNRMLIFKGEIVNNGQQEYLLPKVRVSLHDEQGNLLDYWKAAPEKSSLKPQEKTSWMVYFHNPDMSKISEFKTVLSK